MNADRNNVELCGRLVRDIKLCEKKSGKAKWCTKHHPLYQALEYQSKKAGNQKTHEAIFADTKKAASAFERFEKENPPGQYRKSVVDWSAWGKSFGVRKSIKDSERQEEMDIRDYIGYQKNRGYSDAEARAMWKE